MAPAFSANDGGLARVSARPCIQVSEEASRLCRSKGTVSAVSKAIVIVCPCRHACGRVGGDVGGWRMQRGNSHPSCQGVSERASVGLPDVTPNPDWVYGDAFSVPNPGKPTP